MWTFQNAWHWSDKLHVSFQKQFHLYTLWAPPLRRYELNDQISMPNQIRFTYTPLTWWCWRAMNSCCEPICICSIIQWHTKWRKENQVSYSVLPLRCMYLLAISVSLQIIQILFKVLIKSRQNFHLKQGPYQIPAVRYDLKALPEIKILRFRNWGYFKTDYCFLQKFAEQLSIAQACKAVRRMAKRKHTLSTWQMQSTAGKE